MKNKKFYSPIKSLVNLILTGEKKINQDVEFIPITQELVNSLINIDGNYNMYFLSCIENFLSSCSKEEKVNVIKVLCENEDLLHGVSLVNGLIANSKSSNPNNSPDTIDSVILNFLIKGQVHHILTLSIYFYIESIATTNILNGKISKNDYEKIIEFHSIKRDLKDLFIF
ncbi:hypothetical protein [Flavobacterium crassostreae]|uniref:Uncharacterized protein n=1 Tax=Flavobacterium crassostreae TaxID=1763534 RepID=A0A1B9EA73_9FLAO|nr:hypothetical protein [Flavobacterium crassostreae]OCB78849.1 hypothetical protein LPBF_00240 [Flavobacterium crassostreae]